LDIFVTIFNECSSTFFAIFRFTINLLPAETVEFDQKNMKIIQTILFYSFSSQ